MTGFMIIDFLVQSEQLHLYSPSRIELVFILKRTFPQ